MRPNSERVLVDHLSAGEQVADGVGLDDAEAGPLGAQIVDDDVADLVRDHRYPEGVHRGAPQCTRDADRLKHDERRLARDRAHASATRARAHEAGRRAKDWACADLGWEQRPCDPAMPVDRAAHVAGGDAFRDPDREPADEQSVGRQRSLSI